MKSACAVLYVICGPSDSSIFFPHYLINGTIFRGKNDFYFSLQLLFEIFLSLRRVQQVIITNIHWCSRKVPVILVRF